MTISNNLTQLNDAGTSGDWTTNGFDSPNLNNSASTVPYYIEGATCQDWPLKKGQTDGYTYDDIGNVDFTGQIFVAHFYIPAPDVTNIPLDEFWVQLSSDAGYTTNYGRWDGLAAFSAQPGSFVPIPVYLTNPDETAGTLVINSVSSMGFTATTGNTNDGKAAAFDHFYIVSEFGGHSETWSGTFFDDLIDDATSGSDAEIAFGVLERSGDFFESKVNIALGDGAADTANTDVTEIDKTIYFNNIQPEQELGYICNNPSGGNENRLALTRVVQFWNSQPVTADIFTDPQNLDEQKINACSFSNGGRLPLRTWVSDALTFMTNSTVTTCWRVEPSTALCAGNTIQDTSEVAADSGALLLDSISHRVSGNTISKGTAASHAIVIETVGTYSLSEMTFIGYNAANGNTDSTIRNESGGAVVINASNITGNISYQNGAGASTTINNTVSITLAGMKDLTEVRVCDKSNPPGELAGIENATVGTVDDRSFTFALDPGTIVDITVFNVQWRLPPNNRIDNFTIPSADTTIPISQVIDRNYENL